MILLDKLWYNLEIKNVVSIIKLNIYHGYLAIFMENKETLSRTLNNSKSQLKWLEIAEYSALGTSILTLFFEQISYYTCMEHSS